MKTTLREHKELVEEIQSLDKIRAIKRLRQWLSDNGYEEPTDCKHYAIMRTTGQCMACKTQISDPVVIGSDEALNELRRKLSQG